jgi:hypothetical protein
MSILLTKIPVLQGRNPRRMGSYRYSSSALVGISKGFDGPAGSKLEASIPAVVEWDNTGITDVGAIVGVEGKSSGYTVAGADVKITVNTGVSTTGKGILQGIEN